MLIYGPPDYFDIEHKAVGYALTIKQASDVAAVNFEAALCVGKLIRYFHYMDREPVKKLRADVPVKPVVNFDISSRQVARAVCDIVFAGL
jgi:hypothetical protein